MKRIYTKTLNKISINKKLFFITVIGAVLPIAILLFLVFSQIRYEYETRRDFDIQSIVETIVFDVNTSLSNGQHIIQSYMKDGELLRLIEQSEKNIDLLQQVESKIDLDIFSDNLLKNIVIYYDKGYNYDSEYFKSLDEVIDQEWYTDIEATRYQLNIVRESDSIVLTKSLNARDYHTNAIIKVILDPHKFRQLLENQLLNEMEAQAYIVDPEGAIVAGSEEYSGANISDMKLDDNSMVSKKIGDEYFFKGWQLYVVVDDDVLSYNFKEKIFLLFGFEVLITGLILVLNYTVSRSIGKRLKILNDTMTANEDGKLMEIEEEMGTDEIGQTATVYNKMIRRIKQLIQEVHTEKVKSDRLLHEKTVAYNEINHNYEKIRSQTNQINSLVYKDTLTGLMNRLAITEYIESKVNLESEVGVMFLDVDNFKFINDTYGHDLGDQVIKATAEILVAHNLLNIEIGRFGGDEFLIVVSGCDKSNVMEHAKLIQESFLNPVIIDDKKFYLTVSIGVACFPEHGLNHMDLLKKADLALYEAKDAGRNTTKLYHNGLDLDLEERLAFRNAIKDAFSKQEFYLNYQPYYKSEDMSLIGFEALIRWHSDLYGQVSPYKLVTQAEAMGLIIDLGEWIIEEACQFAKKINENVSHKKVVSINISMIQLLSHDFYDKLMLIVNTVGISPECIVLEMTETILIDSIDSGVTVVEQLRKTGFGIALDDFGTGYSSLSYLKKLPVSILKIDKSFVDHIATDEEFVNTIISIAHNRNLFVVAEGVEHLEQVDLLKRLNCDALQGYYLNKPMSEVNALKL